MRATNFQLAAPGSLGAWLARSPKEQTRARSNGAGAKPTLMERFDRWLWAQHVREREAYLAQAQDIFELEERIRRLERSVDSRYY